MRLAKHDDRRSEWLKGLTARRGFNRTIVALANKTARIARRSAMTLHLGIDIGVQGAIAIVDRSGALLGIHDMPVLQDGPKGRRAINAPLLAAVIFKSHADHAFVEGVGARPGEGPTGAFAFGRARGVIEGVLAATGVPVTFVSPSASKRAVGLTLAFDPSAKCGWLRHPYSPTLSSALSSAESITFAA